MSRLPERQHVTAKNDGISVIEVVVALTIVALLFIFLAPKLQGVRRQAAASRCVANLRQIGGGLALYMQDHRVFPYYITGSTRWHDGNADPKSFFAGPYLNVMARAQRGAKTPVPSAKGTIFDCPAIEREHKTALGSEEWTADFFDYGLNISLCGRPAAGIPNPSTTVAIVEGGHYARVKAKHTKGITYTPTETSNPGGTTWDWGETNGGPGILVYQHGKRANFLFFDGHVGQHQQSELAENWFNAR